MKELVIKAEELQQLQRYLDEIPHKYGKDIEQFINSIAVKRFNESQPKKDEVEVEAENATQTN